MRRSSGMGGARMLRAMGRSVGAGVKEKFSTAGAHGKASKSPRVISVSPPPLASPTPSSKSSLTCYVDGDEWEPVGDDIDGDFGSTGCGFRERFVFGPAPTEEETQEAMATMEQMFVPVRFSQVAEIEYSPYLDGGVVDKMATLTEEIPRHSYTGSESDWKEPPPDFFSKSSESDGQEFADAVHLYQRNPPFKSMVNALTNDPVVWSAVMNNGVVQELKKAFYKAQSSEVRVPDDDPDVPTGILRWIMDGTKGKIMEFFDMISKFVNEIFHPQENRKSEEFNDFVRSSFMLCVVAFIIVAATRIQKS